MSETPLELTILMPCLNETETLARCITKAKAFLERSGIRGEVVIADNGSTDGSQALAREHGARVVDVPLRGYGAALHAGATAASGTYVIMGDSDDSYDFSKLDLFVENLRKGDDLVMGNRFKGGVMPGAMPFKNRYLGNPVLSGLGRLFFASPIGDFHCGLRGFSRAAFLKMELKTTGMEFASEMVIKARLLGLRVSEVPTVLHKDGRSRPPHLRPWRDGWRHLRFMLLYSPRWLFLYPGLAVSVLGLALLVRLWFGPWFILGVGLDVHTMLYAAAMVLLGYQAVLFAAFSRSFAIEEGLLPPSRTVLRLFRYLNLEVGLLVGTLLTLLGVLATAAAFSAWGRADFGALDSGRTLRTVIPSMLAMVVGLQTVLASFFLSMLGLRLRRGVSG